ITFGPVGMVVQALRKTRMGRPIPHFFTMTCHLLLRRRRIDLPPPARTLWDIGIVAFGIIAIIPVRAWGRWLNIDLGSRLDVHRRGWSDDHRRIYIRPPIREYRHHDAWDNDDTPMTMIAVPSMGWDGTS